MSRTGSLLYTVLDRADTGMSMLARARFFLVNLLLVAYLKGEAEGVYLVYENRVRRVGSAKYQADTTLPMCLPTCTTAHEDVSVKRVARHVIY